MSEVNGRQLVEEFLRRMSEKDVAFERDGEILRANTPANALTPTDTAFIRDNKAEILAAIADHAGASDGGEGQLSFLQERIWSHQKMFPEMALYNLASVWRLTGDLDTDAFSRAFQRVFARHDILRARFSEEEGAPFVLYPTDVDCSLTVEKLPQSMNDDALLANLRTLRNEPIAFGEDGAYRARLFQRSAIEHFFFFAPHHLIWDGLSWDIFLRDLAAYYSEETGGAPTDLPALEGQFSDFAARQQNWMKSSAPEQELAHWRNYFDGETPPLALPADCKRPKLFSYKGGAVSFAVPPQLASAIRAYATKYQCTAFMIYMAAWQAFLHRITGQSDIILGTPAQGRDSETTTNLIGCFGNTLGLRSQFDSAESFSAFVLRMRENFLNVLERQKAPMEYLAQKLRGSIDISRTALFQAMFTYQNTADRPDAIGDIAIEEIDIGPGGAPTDIHLEITDDGHAAIGAINYSTDVMTEEGAQYLARCFEAFLSDAMAQPDQPLEAIAMMPAAERRQLLSEWNETGTDYRRNALVVDYFDDAATTRPDAPAVSMDGEMLSYGELQARANTIGNYLQANGVEEGDIVAVYMDRSLDMVASILGLWKAGAALLPIDPGFPKGRLAYMLEDAQAKTVLTTTPLIEDWLLDAAPVIDLAGDAASISAMPTTAPVIDRDAALSRAYVIYTSGSTGKPKGVENAHPALCNFIESMLSEPGMRADDRVLAVTTISFDVMLLELFVTLAAGAEIVLASNDDAMDGFALADILEQRDITVLQGTPATWRILLEAGWTGKPDLKCLCGGEPMPATLADQLPKMVGELWNMYGPTETTVWSTCARIESGDDIHVGGPVANTQVYILDAGGAPTPAGVAGDLWIGGDGVALGYLGKPDMTAERFHDNPFVPTAGRIYNTGDRARWRRDGTVEIMGRVDDQIKIRGYRIELGDVETALGKHSAIAQAAAALRTDHAGEPTLVGYAVFKDGQSATTSELRRFMREYVPHYMTPQFFVTLPALPLTNNNKVDRKALPAPAGVAATAQRVAPRTPHEVALARIWTEILQTSEISVTDNFFELGGQSLHAARMIAQVRDATGLVITPREVIFESLEQLAAEKAAA